jgi:hypothetical protein
MISIVESLWSIHHTLKVKVVSYLVEEFTLRCYNMFLHEFDLASIAFASSEMISAVPLLLDEPKYASVYWFIMPNI